MYKHLLLLLLLPLSLYAEPGITYSGTFPEPNMGVNRIFFLENGNTIWVNLNNTLRLRMYDAQRKEIADKTIAHKAKMKGGEKIEYFIKDMFEKNGKVLLFLQRETPGRFGTIGNSERSLYLAIINPQTGDLTEVKELASVNQIKSVGYDLTNMVSNDLYIANDLKSDQYSVLQFNGYTAKAADRVKVYVYNGSNELVKEAVLHTELDDKKFIHQAGFCMYNKCVYIGSNEDDAQMGKSYELPYYFSKLEANATSFETKQINITPYHINSRTRIAYNPVSNKVDVLSVTKTKKDGKKTNLALIDPVTLTGSSFELSDASLSAFSRTTLGDKKGFDMDVSSMQMNVDGTVLITPIETYEKAFSNGKTSYTKTYTSKIGLITYDAEGKEKNVSAVRIRPNAQVSAASWEYYDHKIIQADDAYYLIVNDIAENIKRPETDDPHPISSIADSHTVLCKISGKNIERSYLFGQPEKGEYRFSMISSGEYDTNSKTLAVIVVENKRGNKTARIAWVEF